MKRAIELLRKLIDTPYCDPIGDMDALVAEAKEFVNSSDHLGWQPIATAPKDGTGIIVGFDSASVWIVCNSWYRDAADVKEMRECGAGYDPNEPLETDIGWWSYRSSVTQELIEPTHWLCETNQPKID